MRNYLKDVKDSCAEVATHAQLVKIDMEKLRPYANSIGREIARRPVAYDKQHHFVGDPETTLAYIFILDAVNFGSGFFDRFKALIDGSGYYVIASRLKARFEKRGPYTTHELKNFREQDGVDLLGQISKHNDGRLALFASLFSTALAELGKILDKTYGGKFENIIFEADGRANSLINALRYMKTFDDQSSLDGMPVYYYKKAQLLVWDLHLAFAARGYGRFVDIGDLTAFADNLLPHILQVDGVITYDESLFRAVNSSVELPVGSRAEIEIRACTVYAIERVTALIREQGYSVSSAEIDYYLWNLGHRESRYRSSPRHKTLSFYY